MLFWMRSIDVILDKIAKKVSLNELQAVFGSCQQHTSVWRKNFPGFLDPEKSLEEIFLRSFALKLFPVWADSSTSRECRAVEAKLEGGFK